MSCPDLEPRALLEPDSTGSASSHVGSENGRNGQAPSERSRELAVNSFMKQFDDNDDGYVDYVEFRSHTLGNDDWNFKTVP
ncbi:hypothetical protein PoB_002558700 [Plakobranchus ocellatus]|uniref:EF-hand domain-containing protein n=1 Tax=Plakobranchus ocellatus TaxID=259542 RepID=A0AAV3ZWZ5_9GAST|nr:hypothetical protein PoB_002558700 [Plakobranchus ocellatus]